MSEQDLRAALEEIVKAWGDEAEKLPEAGSLSRPSALARSAAYKSCAFDLVNLLVSLQPSPSEDVRVLRGKVDENGFVAGRVYVGPRYGSDVVEVTIRRIPKEEVSQGEA
jgi:hypothetical protein